MRTRVPAFFARNSLSVVGAVILLVMALAVAVGPWLLTTSPTRLDVLHKLQAPDAAHWFGTDSLGRDVFTRTIFGGRYTLAIGMGVVALAFAAGVTAGTVAGTFGGWLDMVVMRIADAILSFPSLVLAIALAAAFGPSLTNAMLAVSITLAPQFARLARGQALGLASRPFVEAAVSLGLPTRRILVNYVLLNGLGPLLVQASLSVGSAILQTASLGFLGLGAQPPLPEWGADVSASLQFVRESPWVALAPGLAILLIVLGFNLIGDALADWFNPRRRAAL